ncbi:hypothetical protein [Salinigranum rubrum]
MRDCRNRPVLRLQYRTSMGESTETIY